MTLFHDEHITSIAEMTAIFQLADRRRFISFAAGCLAVTAGVATHLPMYWMGRHTGFQLAGMPMQSEMWLGMALIVAGVGMVAYGLSPKHFGVTDPSRQLKAGDWEDSSLRWPHWQLMLVLTIALVIDVMKPASLGFVLPGMAAEYTVSKATVAWLPFSALAGTVVGSVVWGLLADLYGRRASILLSAVIFVGTSICGAMPSLWWNVAMCFLMGAAAGGMLPVTYALLAETIPLRHRGWALVMVGGLGSAGGYLVASVCSAWLEPIFSWRSLWFLNLPTGLLLILLNALIPESPKFLVSRGREREADAMLKRFGYVTRGHSDSSWGEIEAPIAGDGSIRQGQWARTLWALSIAGIAWGLTNFGLLLWMPATLVERGFSMASSSDLLAKSALLAIPIVLLAAMLYGRWSSKGALLGSIGLTIGGLAGIVHLEFAPIGTVSPVWSIALLVVGSNAMIAMLLPFTAESFPVRIRGRATGLVAGCTKAGGLIVQAVGLLSWTPALSTGTALVLAVAIASGMLVMWSAGSPGD